MLWGEIGHLLGAHAWRFGSQEPTNNAAELAALWEAMKKLKELPIAK